MAGFSDSVALSRVFLAEAKEKTREAAPLSELEVHVDDLAQSIEADTAVEAEELAVIAGGGPSFKFCSEMEQFYQARVQLSPATSRLATMWQQD